MSATDATQGSGAALAQLAGELGVQLEYENVDHETVRASDESLRAVIEALGVSASSPRESLAAVRAERAARAVEPVHVVWDGEAAPLQLGAGVPRPVECVLTLETGDEQVITVAPGEAATLPPGLPFGYHTLTVGAGGPGATSRIISAPRLTHTGGLDRSWGLFLPLYAARSKGDWGIGDLGSARELLELVGSAGGRLVGSTPMLATFLDEPFEPSPYAPVSRTFWNEAHLELERLPELERSSAARDLLRDRDVLRERERLRGLTEVDHRAVYALKRRVLEACAAEHATGDGRRLAAFEAWRAEHPLVDAYAAFRADLETGGPDAEHYHRYVQWAMETQLADVTSRSSAGLYLDMPLGIHPAGFDRARHAELFAPDMSIGAPPDPLALGGQDWGLPPLLPGALRESGYDYAIASVRHLMRHAAALRVDHVMGMHRLFWIPTGLGAARGVYVSYEAHEQWAIVCLESHRSGCLVVGEDLGTVPPAVRTAMREHGASRMYVAQFELDTEHPDAAIRPVPECSLAAVNTHDTPTWATAWADLDDDARRVIVRYLRDVAVLPDGTRDAELLADPVAVHAAVLRLLARGPAGAVIANAEDLWGETEPQNVPGTSSAEAPNWVRRSTRTIDQIRHDETIMTQLKELTSLREGDASIDHLARPGVRHDVMLLTDQDLHLFAEGTHNQLHRVLGSHPHTVDGVAGTWFAVWAPNAEAISVIGDFNGWTPGDAPLVAHAGGSGIWHGWIPQVGHGEHYKYHLRSRERGYTAEKADPFARRAELPPRTASVVWHDDHAWSDDAWMAERSGRNGLDAPMSVY
ncbi:MAG: MalQ, partial [Thermoleophilia bacterium]|nr:MalQ [Thermoleophilia bacterium]